MLRITVIVGTLLTTCIVAVLMSIERQSAPHIQGYISVNKVLANDAHATEGFARATQVREFVFPDDHASHEEFKTEWWYFTGNLVTQSGRRFGYQLTFFRSALKPRNIYDTVHARYYESWTSSQIYMAHCTVTDVQNNAFYCAERFSRSQKGLAGCLVVERAGKTKFRVWVENWYGETDSSARRGSIFPLRLEASIGDSVRLSFTLDSVKPTVLQGNSGLSQKSATPGNASYYYSQSRMVTHGILTIRNESCEVHGLSWMDREWSTSALERHQVGWDWFALHLDDGRDIMFYQLRARYPDGTIQPDTMSSGVIVYPDGTQKQIRYADAQLIPHGKWRSPVTGALYPKEWKLVLLQSDIQITTTPLVANQELDATVRYWEGAVRVHGWEHGRVLSGYGYVEMTGYADTQGQNMH
ncbi:MAG: lipocalin-like domain-containing protein [Bacteroidota bacterium]|nr:carotenoid 1,2-hydratase [Candidatus Kapabacteria bacterium]MDW8219014.1 lipocalin-like domain-containing protein [Bacteroidota bacterium]